MIIDGMPASAITLIVNVAGRGPDDVRRFSAAMSAQPAANVDLRLLDGADGHDLRALLRGMTSDLVAYLPAGSALAVPDVGGVPAGEDALAVWLPGFQAPADITHMHPHAAPAEGWIASTALLRRVPTAAGSRPMEIAAGAAAGGPSPLWMSAGGAADWPAPPGTAGPIGEDARVLAIVPHFRGERWLHQGLESLVRQQRPPENIVVVDDSSAQPPLEIVRRFDDVTLMRASENVGPYRLLQQVVDDTDYDAYLPQDADDWSSADRLALLLRAAAEAGAGMAGCQELRVMDDDRRLLPVSYPRDVNDALYRNPVAYPLLQPSSLISRELIRRTGGFATGLRFGGDSEFLRRAVHVGRVVNVPRFAYFRRDHPASLTHAPDTGFQSPARKALSRVLQERAVSNGRAARDRGIVDLAPIRTAPPVRLTHVCGPRLRPAVPEA